MIKTWLSQTSMYRLMIYYLGALLLAGMALSMFGILPYVWWHIGFDFAILWLSCALTSWLCAKIFRTQRNPESELITALILALIVGPLDPLIYSNLLLLAGVGAISQASKYLLAINKKHIFNPAAVAVLLAALFLHQGASWWVGDRHLLWIMVIGGALILHKLRWFHLSLSFLIPYLAVLTAQQGWRLDYLAILSPLLFFSTVMLIEPLTSPTGRRKRILYGVCTALILAGLINYSSLPYTLELALTMANFAFWWTKIKQRIILKFINKEPGAKDIYKFWFEPLKKFSFRPGQFLQWTLPHSRADDRGTRRWFTIASSPTEEKVLLTTKFSDRSSTFKQALRELKPGAEIATSDPDGDFILPIDPTMKLVFIAGGIGITPYRSMIKYLLDTKQSRDIIIIYAAKTAEEFSFKELLAQATEIGLNTIYIQTEKTGFITPEMIKKEIPDWAQRTFYISGPEPMVEAYEKMLKETGIKDAGIRTDFFPGYE